MFKTKSEITGFASFGREGESIVLPYKKTRTNHGRESAFEHDIHADPLGESQVQLFHGYTRVAFDIGKERVRKPPADLKHHFHVSETEETEREKSECHRRENILPVNEGKQRDGTEKKSKQKAYRHQQDIFFGNASKPDDTDVEQRDAARTDEGSR